MAKQWIDENGLEIPTARITKSEKMREAAADRLLKKANEINRRLAAFKDEVSESADEIMAQVFEENGVNSELRKGNFTFYNFDRSIRVEVSMQERIDFDDAMIAVAKEHFDEFLATNSSALDEMIRQLIMDAFSTSRGKLDTKKVLSLVKYRQRVPATKYPKFHAAIDAIEKAIRRPDSKRYFRIAKRNGNGEYDNVELNFSSI
jgi:hypothetical protein